MTAPKRKGLRGRCDRHLPSDVRRGTKTWTTPGSSVLINAKSPWEKHHHLAHSWSSSAQEGTRGSTRQVSYQLSFLEDLYLFLIFQL